MEFRKARKGCICHTHLRDCGLWWQSLLGWYSEELKADPKISGVISHFHLCQWEGPAHQEFCIAVVPTGPPPLPNSRALGTVQTCSLTPGALMLVKSMTNNEQGQRKVSHVNLSISLHRSLALLIHSSRKKIINNKNQSFPWPKWILAACRIQGCDKWLDNNLSFPSERLLAVFSQCHRKDVA